MLAGAPPPCLPPASAQSGSTLSVNAAWGLLLRNFLAAVQPDKVEWASALLNVQYDAVLRLLRPAYGEQPAFTTLLNASAFLFSSMTRSTASESSALVPVDAVVTAGQSAKRKLTTTQSATKRLRLRPPANFASCPPDSDAARQVPADLVLAASDGFSEDVLRWLRMSFSNATQTASADLSQSRPSWCAWETVYGSSKVSASLEQTSCAKSSAESPCSWHKSPRRYPLVVLDHPLPKLLWVQPVRCQHGTQVTCDKETLATLAGAVCVTRKIRCTPRFARWVLDHIQDTFN